MKRLKTAQESGVVVEPNATVPMKRIILPKEKGQRRRISQQLEESRKSYGVHVKQ
ncbi:hypothetical protein JHK86_022286 [Glycine max]|nr:hypothetical protein JHK86_022286 [Glycine max]